MPAFIQTYEHRMGVATFRTPYTTITAFIGLLAVLEQNLGAAWQALLRQTPVEQFRRTQTAQPPSIN